MKYLKLFEDYKDIDTICKKYIVGNYTINDDKTIDVNRGSVYLSNEGFTELPLKFGKVWGNFHCDNNELTSLEGCPTYVHGSFDCSVNDLTSLDGCPKKVGSGFFCSGNNLTSLIGS